MNRAFLVRVAMVAGVLALGSACTMKEQEAPPLMGPSELDQSIAVSVSPDVLPQDGASQSVITVTARDAAAQPIRSLSLRAETLVGGVPVDFGTLSARSVTTGANGIASFVYTAPMSPPLSEVPYTTVDIVVTPIGTDANNIAQRLASIRVIPQGTIAPPTQLQAAFTVTPDAPQENQTVLFDASTSTPAAEIAEYRWNFGDGGRSSGRVADHDYSVAGTYVVTLTIVDQYGRSASASRSVAVGQGAQPTASFTSSPSNPVKAQPVFFNASASRPAAGRTLTSYQWDFGDGSSGNGVQTNHSFAAEGTYSVTLTVTDDVGRSSTTTQSVTILGDDPVADFSFTPSAPVAGLAVAFNASASKAVPGRSIVSYIWDFGDGTSGSGVTVSKIYLTIGVRNVTLTVTDNTGRSSSVVKPVQVQ